MTAMSVKMFVHSFSDKVLMEFSSNLVAEFIMGFQGLLLFVYALLNWIPAIY